MPGPSYLLIDADGHYYEPEDCWSRHIEPAYADYAIRVRNVDSDGETAVMVAGDQHLWAQDFFMRSVPAPGSFTFAHSGAQSAGSDEYDVAFGGLADGVEWTPTASVPCYVNRDARLAEMDRQGVQATVLHPSNGLFPETDLRRIGMPAPAVYANIRSFNRWLEEDWGYSYQDRIFASAQLSLLDPTLAVEELGRVLALGARVVSIFAMAGGENRSPADPSYDPFWARCQEAQVPVVVHVSGPPPVYLEVAKYWGEADGRGLFTSGAMSNFCVYSDRYVMDFFAAMIFGNVFSRFPKLQLMSIEIGFTDWLPYMLKKLDKVWRMRYATDWPQGRPELPSQLVKEHLTFNWFIEENPYDLIDLVGPQRVVFGSDWPHPEGASAPADFVAKCAKLPEPQLRDVLRENTARLLKIGP